ncbi:mannitol dehydrogenase [Bordetella genomosp. 9]|uniref:mannitol dehydrogenase family protein n=1 Tax=Bordetella genomosp. 9 TaxID=1416803 RepID=UPI000A2901EA|nr:mannitol dehydrogenase family protein [Bordetella genomosp. 9]ARP89953.1 mannitol dehydrogenase [Bordetella genomosp. 9]
MNAALPRLNRQRLPQLSDHLPAIPWKEPRIGIVHLGLGNFHRAHQAMYTEDAMLAGGGDWGICGVSLRRPDTRDALAPQDYLYSVLVRDTNGQRVRIARALRRILVAPEEPQAVLDAMCDERVKIVSLTVTEKGYCQDPKTGGLDFEHPLIVRDLKDPDHPQSVPGYLVAALKRRRQHPFTVLSCDNLSHNGAALRRVTVDYATALDPALGRWIEDAVAFPSTMVDRIVPATTDADRDAAARALGCVDAWPVPSESYRQWVIEDRFPAGRPAWEQAGALMVDDVTPYEAAKLRMLNGSHSTLVYLSLLADIETVDQAVANPDLRGLLHRLMTDDIAPTLTVPASFDRLSYRDQLLQRLANPALKHRCIQIAMDGSQKLPPRLLGTAADRLRAGYGVDRLALGVAGWMRFLLGRSESGAALELSDPMAARLSALAAQGADGLVERVLAVREIFPAALAEDPRFSASLKNAYDALGRDGALATARRYASL